MVAPAPGVGSNRSAEHVRRASDAADPPPSSAKTKKPKRMNLDAYAEKMGYLPNLFHSCSDSAQ